MKYSTRSIFSRSPVQVLAVYKNVVPDGMQRRYTSTAVHKNDCRGGASPVVDTREEYPRHARDILYAPAVMTATAHASPLHEQNAATNPCVVIILRSFLVSQDAA